MADETTDGGVVEALLMAIPRHLSKRSWSGANKKGWGWPEFLFVHDSPKTGVNEEMLSKKENEKTLIRQRKQ